MRFIDYERNVYESGAAGRGVRCTESEKCNIVLQEMGGKYENQYAAAMLGNMAQCKFAPGTLVAVTLRFTTREYNGQVYQDILVTDIEKLGK